MTIQEATEIVTKPASVHFSSDSDEWSTPQDFYDKLDEEFEHFTLDPCCTPENAKCPRYFTKEIDGLTQDWGTNRVFVNPPYSQLRAWVCKCANAATGGATVVLLIPARTDTRAFHDHVYDQSKHQFRPGVEVRFIKGRLKFGGSKNSAPFPSMICIFRPYVREQEDK
jgi:site-specific DNA-methyltransferase (adenine-specific)